MNLPDRLPPELIRRMLENWATRLCKEVDVDPVVGSEAVDVIFDSTLTYAELKTLLEEELARRGIFGIAPKADTPEFRQLAELPSYKPEKPPKPPRAPRTIEEAIKEFERETGERLVKIESIGVERWEREQVPIPWVEMTEEQRREHEITHRAPTREEMVRHVEVVPVPAGMNFFADTKKRYYEITDYKLKPIAYDKIVGRVRRVMRPVVPKPRPPAPRRIWPFRGGPAPPELKRGMSDEEIKRVYAERGITLSDEGVKYMRERFGV